MNRELLPLVSEWNASPSDQSPSPQVVLYCIGIGTPERAVDFCSETGYPAQHLLADPENICYDRLSLRFGVRETFFSINTPFAMRKRIFDDGAATLREVLSRWKPWLPPKQKQTFNQGGCIVIQDKTTFLVHKDEATGDHVDFNDVIKVVQSLYQQ